MKLFIATPSQDSTVHAAYAFSMMHLLLSSKHEFHMPTDMYDGDLVRIRSRYVADFLETDCSHLLFIDADVDFRREVVDGMIAADRDFVAAPYRRKLPEVNDARAMLVEGPRQSAASLLPVAYPIHMIDDPEPRAEEDERHMLHQIGAIGLGMALLTRSMLVKMCNVYESELLFYDRPGRGRPPRPTVALFQLMIAAGRDLLSEDLSFCRRWRDLDGTIWMYLGAGSPVGHHGSHRYGGRVADFGSVKVS